MSEKRNKANHTCGATVDR